MVTQRAFVCAVACWWWVASWGADAFAPAAVAPVVRALPPLRPLRSGVGVLQHRRCAALSMGKTQLVTYGDMWRDALVEDENGNQIAGNEDSEGVGLDSESVPESDDGNDFTYAMEELSLQASEVVRPIKRAATKVASAVWNKLSPSPDDAEVQRNLKAFAKGHSGAIGTPMDEQELASEVRFMGMFPDLVDALLEAQEEDETPSALSREELSGDEDASVEGNGDDPEMVPLDLPSHAPQSK